MSVFVMEQTSWALEDIGEHRSPKLRQLAVRQPMKEFPL